MKKAELIFTVALVPVDFVLVTLAGLTAYFWRFGWLAEVRPVIFDLPLGQFLQVSLVSAAVFVAIFALAGLYSIFGPRQLKLEIGRVFIASAAAVLALIAFVFFQREMFESRFIILAAWLFSFLYVSLGRIAVRMLQRYLLRFGVGAHRMAIIGNGHRTTQLLVDEFSGNPFSGYQVIKRFERFDNLVRGELDLMAKADQIDEILVTDPRVSRDELSQIFGFAQSRHLTFKYAADPLAAQAANLEVGVLAGVPLVEVKNTRLDGWGRVFKRIFDFLISLGLLIILSPVLLLTAIIIKLDSRGPVFFSRLDDGTKVTRVGEHGRPFPYLKFRSMKPGTHNQRYNELADQNLRQEGPLVKIKDDPRVTRVGRFIRRWSIDELPELFLVLTGHMSLVGPRPHLPEEVEQYDDTQRRVLTVKPGITGLAQVSGRSDLEFDEEARLDIWYIENWSPWLDLAILIKTPWAVISRRQAS
jgi:exopolysaccharide biosynthesis polyprenyl glycosylphosphotransferase